MKKFIFIFCFICCSIFSAYNQIAFDKFHLSLNRNTKIDIGFASKWYSSPEIQFLINNFSLFLDSNSQFEISSRIPKIIHFIWLGSEPTVEVLETIQTWRDYHPNYLIKIWRDCDADKIQWTSHRIRNHFKHAKSFAEKADLLRYQILYNYGGIYADTDVLCVSSFDKILKTGVNFFAGFECGYIENFEYAGEKPWEKVIVSNALIGATAYHPIIEKTINSCRTQKMKPTWGVNERTGPAPLSTNIQSFLHNLTKNPIINKSLDNSILILPCTYFYPVVNSELGKKLYMNIKKCENLEFGETMAIHLYWGSWLK